MTPDAGRAAPDSGSRVGHVAAELRKRRSESLRQVAHRARMSPIHLSRVERLESSPTEETIRALAAAHEVPVGVLFGESQVPKDAGQPGHGSDHAQSAAGDVAQSPIGLEEQLRSLSGRTDEILLKLHQLFAAYAARPASTPPISLTTVEPIHPPRNIGTADLHDPLADRLDYLRTQDLRTKEGTEWWVKGAGGVTTMTLPLRSESYRKQFLRSFRDERGDPSAPRVLEGRRSRATHRQRQLQQGRRELRYIIPRASIEHYVETGLPDYDEYEAQFSDWRAPEEERIQRMENLLELLRYDQFQLGLLDSPPQDLWWGVFNHGMILFEHCIGAPTEGSQFVVEGAEAIQRYDRIFQRMWDELPVDSKEKKAVVGWLASSVKMVS